MARKRASRQTAAAPSKESQARMTEVASKSAGNGKADATLMGDGRYYRHLTGPKRDLWLLHKLIG